MAAISNIVSRWIPRAQAEPTTRTAVQTLHIERGPTDVILLWAVLTLCGIGLVAVYSGSALTAYHNSADGNDLFYVWRQFTGVAVGLVAMLGMSRVDYRALGRHRYWVLGFAVLLLIMTLIPGLGHTVNGSTRWVALGPLQFQPGEVAKVAAAIYFAGNIAQKSTNLSGLLEFGGNFVVLAILVGILMMQPDLGTSVIIGALMFSLLLLGGARWLYLNIVIGGGVVLVGCAIFMSRYGYRIERIRTWLNPWEDPSDAGYQLVSSYTALASGGATGTGFGQGRSWLGYVPEMYNDFVAAGIGEEFGLIGIGALLVLYIIVLWRGIVIADRATDRFGYLLALGITTLIVMQAGINLGVVTGMLPTKGVTLPFVSYGRSSIVILLVAVGVLLNIGQHNPDMVREASEERRRRRADQARRQKQERVARHRKQHRARHTQSHNAV